MIDSFHVFRGDIADLTAQTFIHVLRDPGCFYFINITCMSDPDENGDQRVIRRELCWLTDPLGPRLKQGFSEALHVEWNHVKFCGIKAPGLVNSVTYMIEIAEGVEWKDGVMTRYMSDLISTEYKTVFYGQNVHDLIINNLKPSHWYHLRLVIEYLGVRVMSESVNVHTHKAPPSPPSQPKISIVAVRNSFDLSSNVPVRLEVLISWLPSIAHGSEIERYQVHLKRFDQYGNLLSNDPPFLSKKQHGGHAGGGHSQKTITKLIKPTKDSNQWVGSPGRSEVQIRNSLQLRAHSPSRNGSPKNRSSVDSLFPSTPDGKQRRNANSANSWRIIYDNLNRNVKLGSPFANDAVWWIRVRAKNSLGWSEFSDLRIINQKTHPSLFTVGFSSMASYGLQTAQPPSNDSIGGNNAIPRPSSGKQLKVDSSEVVLPNIQPETISSAGVGSSTIPTENFHWSHHSDQPPNYSIPPEFQTAHKQNHSQHPKVRALHHNREEGSHLPNIHK